MSDINQMSARSGRIIKDDNTIVNEANGINSDGSKNTKVVGSEIIQPTDLQTRYSEVTMTHNAVSVAASASTTRVEVKTKGFSKAVIFHSANGNCQAMAQAVLSNGTIIDTKSLATTASSTKDYVEFNLNGIEKISVYGTDTSAATNAITIEVTLLT